MNWDRPTLSFKDLAVFCVVGIIWDYVSFFLVPGSLLRFSFSLLFSIPLVWIVQKRLIQFHKEA